LTKNKMEWRRSLILMQTEKANRHNPYSKW
jgi:hypothetical protein